MNTVWALAKISDSFTSTVLKEIVGVSQAVSFSVTGTNFDLIFSNRHPLASSKEQTNILCNHVGMFIYKRICLLVEKGATLTDD